MRLDLSHLKSFYLGQHFLINFGILSLGQLLDWIFGLQRLVIIIFFKRDDICFKNVNLVGLRVLLELLVSLQSCCCGGHANIQLWVQFNCFVIPSLIPKQSNALDGGDGSCPFWLRTAVLYLLSQILWGHHACGHFRTRSTP